jgi:hypothetical protein
MKKAAVVFSAAAVMAMTAVSVPTPVEARGGWSWGPGIAGGLIAGALIGGLASNAYGYGPGYGYYGGPGPGYGYYGGYARTHAATVLLGAASLGGLFHVRLDDAHPPSAASWVCANLERRNGSALVAATHGDAAPMILRRYCT